MDGNEQRLIAAILASGLVAKGKATDKDVENALGLCQSKPG